MSNDSNKWRIAAAATATAAAAAGLIYYFTRSKKAAAPAPAAAASAPAAAPAAASSAPAAEKKDSKPEIRKLPAPKLTEAEKKLDFFCRQSVLIPFKPDKQEKVMSKQVALVLGTGGYGTNHAIALCRLGVKKVILVDYDVVEYHNLNRQLLFCRNDIGKSKVFQALENVQHHNVQTEVEAFHGDALKNWDKIVEYAKQSTCIVTSIDVSPGFTYAVMSLGAALGIPVVYGGTEPTAGHYVELHLQTPDGPYADSWGVLPEKDADISALAPDRILGLKSIDFVPPANNPSGGSTTYSCTIGAFIMIGLLSTHLLGLESTPNKVTLNMYTWEYESFKFDKKDKSEIKHALERIKAKK